jgi:hypothetical protein
MYVLKYVCLVQDIGVLVASDDAVSFRRCDPRNNCIIGMRQH